MHAGTLPTEVKGSTVNLHIARVFVRKAFLLQKPQDLTKIQSVFINRVLQFKTNSLLRVLAQKVSHNI